MLVLFSSGEESVAQKAEPTEVRLSRVGTHLRVCVWPQMAQGQAGQECRWAPLSSAGPAAGPVYRGKPRLAEALEPRAGLGPDARLWPRCVGLLSLQLGAACSSGGVAACPRVALAELLRGRSLPVRGQRACDPCPSVHRPLCRPLTGGRGWLCVAPALEPSGPLPAGQALPPPEGLLLQQLPLLRYQRRPLAILG